MGRLEKLLERISEVRKSADFYSAVFSTWHKDVKIVLDEFYGPSMPLREFVSVRFLPRASFSQPSKAEYVNAFNQGLDEAAGFLESRIRDLRETVEHNHGGSQSRVVKPEPDSRKVFVVHGHDRGTKETVARFLGKLDLEPIILHEQPDKGRTIIEKFEDHAGDVQCAVVILTGDDLASPKEQPEKREIRARQNVILELGFFVGRLGRHRTFALVEKDVTRPSDIDGVIYIPLDDGQWRLHLVRELKAAGLDVDANQAF